MLKILFALTYYLSNIRGIIHYYLIIMPLNIYMTNMHYCEYALLRICIIANMHYIFNIIAKAVFRGTGSNAEVSPHGLNDI